MSTFNNSLSAESGSLTMRTTSVQNGGNGDGTATLTCDSCSGTFSRIDVKWQFCAECEMTICPACFIDSHTGTKHKLKPFAEADNEEKEKFDFQMRQLNRQLNSIRFSTNKNNEMRRDVASRSDAYKDRLLVDDGGLSKLVEKFEEESQALVALGERPLTGSLAAEMNQKTKFIALLKAKIEEKFVDAAENMTSTRDNLFKLRADLEIMAEGGSEAETISSSH